MQCHGPSDIDCISCRNRLKSCKIPETKLIKCKPECSKEAASTIATSTIKAFYDENRTFQSEITSGESNLQRIIIYFGIAALILLLCLTIIWWFIFKKWMAKKGVPLDTVAFTNGTQSESQAMISERSENVEEQQIIVGSELPTSGIVNDNLLWDTRVALGAGGFGDVYKVYIFIYYNKLL